MTVNQTKAVSFFARHKILNRIARNWVLYLFLAPAVTYIILFNYVPMYGVLIAFKDFKPSMGILGSPWSQSNGLHHFIRFFSLPKFWLILRNTLTLSLYSLVAGFPLPIALALLLNSTKNAKLKKTTQLITYAPHFISVVIIVGMINILFAPSAGIFSHILNTLGIIDGTLNVLLSNAAFPHLYVWTGVWQGIGWSSIIYIASLSGVSAEMHEAAIVDGATRFQRILKIDLPAIMPTMVIQLILSCGGIMSVGFEKAFLMQNSMNLEASEIISTYVYKMGLVNGEFSFSAAVGLFNSVINLILLLLVNRAARALSDTSLF